jgi:hypothetical protein
VIFGVTLLALLFFAGLAIDAGSLYVTYGQLRRSIDAAAVAAANDYKAEGIGTTENRSRMTKAAMEVLKLHDLETAKMDMKLYLCKDTVKPADFAVLCPNIAAGETQRKLVWINATLEAPLYFLSLLGFSNVPLQSHAVAEAAPIDLVIVIDTSESMADATPGYSTPYDPTTCNAANTCEPLAKAKVAAKGLIDTMYDGYDRVAVIGYDVSVPDLADIQMLDLASAKIAVGKLKVRNDPPYSHIVNRWNSIIVGGNDLFAYNPVYPEDRDGDGADNDEPNAFKPGVPCTLQSPVLESERWDMTINLAGATTLGIPCDDSNYLDSYYWGIDRNSDGKVTIDEESQTTKEQLFATQYRDDGVTPQCSDLVSTPPNCDKPTWMYMTPNSTCTGCGIRAGAQVLKRDGRSNAVWVMVLLSDGLVNLSDTHVSNPAISSSFPLGFCTGGIGSFAWGYDCMDLRKDATLSPRYCLDNPASTCPPGSISALTDTSLYSVYDYALDMIDYAALQKSTNPAEQAGTGSDISIYSIGLGGAGNTPSGASGPIGEYLLRYAAAVGDDGERTPDPCATAATKTNCGQYYYAPSGNELSEIFNDISTRIYSRLTQ